MTHHAPPPGRRLTSLDPDWTLVGRYFRGECTPEEAAMVARWEAADRANADLLALMREAWDIAAVEWPPIDEAEAWKQMRAKMAAAARPVVVRPLNVLPGGRERARRSRLRMLVTGVAAAAVAVTAGALIRHEVLRAPSAPVAMQEYATTRGQRAELLLMDGTRVWLNVDTRLRLRPGYGAKAREVELEGEAYFRVTHDGARPFRVYTRGAVSEDLGTEFNVRAYSDGDERVLVTEGRVAIRPVAAHGEPGVLGRATAPRGSATPRELAAPAEPVGVVLERGQMARLDAAGRMTVVNDVETAAAISWRAGQLRFRRAPVGEVVRELERWYNLDIVLEDPAMAGVLLTATLGERTADQALAIVASVLDARYERQDRRVRLVPRSPPR